MFQLILCVQQLFVLLCYVVETFSIFTEGAQNFFFSLGKFLFHNCQVLLPTQVYRQYLKTKTLAPCLIFVSRVWRSPVKKSFVFARKGMKLKPSSCV